MREQLSGACTTEIAAFDEFAGLLAGERLASAVRPRHLRHGADRPHAAPAAAAARLDRRSSRRTRTARRASARTPGSRCTTTASPRPCERSPTRSCTTVVLVTRPDAGRAARGRADLGRARGARRRQPDARDQRRVPRARPRRRRRASRSSGAGATALAQMPEALARAAGDRGAAPALQHGRPRRAARAPRTMDASAARGPSAPIGRRRCRRLSWRR